MWKGPCQSLLQRSLEAQASGMGNSSTLSVGEPIVAIGYTFASSMTSGLVDKTDYFLAFPAREFSIPNMIQSDVTITLGIFF
jgi:S1-C subfamily serine protease